MATSGEARAMVSALKPKAKILVKKLAKKFTKMQSKNTAEPKRTSTATQNAPFCFDFVKFGKKLCPKAPSAKMRRKKAGSFIATKKTSL